MKPFRAHIGVSIPGTLRFASVSVEAQSVPLRKKGDGMSGNLKDEATETRPVCVTEISGLDEQQRPVTISECDDRYVGAVLDKRNTG